MEVLLFGPKSDLKNNKASLVRVEEPKFKLATSSKLIIVPEVLVNKNYIYATYSLVPAE